MTSCNDCGGIFSVSEFKLGYKEKDGLQCECCGHWVIPEEKRSTSYTVSGITRHGHIGVKNNQLHEFVGHTLRFSKGNDTFAGEIVGESDAVMASQPAGTTSTPTPIRPWAVKVGEKFVHLLPEDGWNVCRCRRA